MQKTCVCAEGKRRQQETKLKMLWIWTPPWENKLSRTKQRPQALDCQQLPSAWKNFANGFPSGTKTGNKMDLVFPGLNFLNDKQESKEGKKIFGKRMAMWVEAQIYASEMMLQNYQCSGRPCAFIKSTGRIWKLKVGYTDICGLYHCLPCCYRWCPTRPALSPWSPRCRADRLARWLHGDIGSPGTGAVSCRVVLEIRSGSSARATLQSQNWQTVM